MLTEQTVLLAGPGGLKAGTRYAIGVLATLLVVVGAVVLFGKAISLPTEPRLNASLDLVVGGVLLAAAAVVVALRRRPPRPAGTHHERRSLTAGAALPFGVFSMATNVTTLALVVPAAKEIASTEGALAGRLVGRADAVPHVMRHHGRTMVGHHDHLQAVRQRELADAADGRAGIEGLDGLSEHYKANGKGECEARQTARANFLHERLQSCARL